MQKIKFYGLGGQGVVTAANIFAEAIAIEEGKYAQAIPAYGHERRGAPVYADVIVDENPIKLKSFVYNPDYVVIFDLSVIDKGVNVMAGTSPETSFIVNAKSLTDGMPFKEHQIFYVDALKIALEVIRRDIPNTTMLGAIAGTGMLKINSIKNTIEKTFGKAGAINAEAAQRAYDQLQTPKQN
ncbi:MAG: 2-oxoacid:acceptor oxidoreductase family protein [Clostridia bacterium]|jgi:pyruvate ferredoxin oxidoreductase gamma subunit|nr:2-oxoacid:acceptor oxidoreductase family protein [Clostridia bacterium]